MCGPNIYPVALTLSLKDDTDDRLLRCWNILSSRRKDSPDTKQKAHERALSCFLSTI